jgi:hypothetical protein
VAAGRGANGNAGSQMNAWRLDSSWVLFPGAPFCDGLLEEYSVSPVLFVKESFWPVEFRQAPLAHEYNKITRRAGVGSGIRNLPISAMSAVAQSSPCRDNPS